MAQRIRALLPKSTFARQVMVMGGGTAVVQALGVLVSPILTRLYTPADFGLMAAFMSVSSIAVVFATLRYDVAISVAAEDADALRLLLISLLSPLLFGMLIAFLAMVLPQSTYRLVSSDPRFVQYRWFLVVAVSGGGLYNALVGWSVRRKAFRALSGSRVFQSSTSIAVQLVVGVLHGGVIGLILGSLLSMTSGIGNLWRQAYRSIRTAFSSGEWRGLRRTAVAYHRYPVYIVWNALMNTASQSVPPIVLSSVFGSTIAGQYALGLRVLQMPIVLVASAVAGVFLSRASSANSAGRLAELVEGVTDRLSLVSSAIFVPIIFFAPILFPILFGQEWREAGVYSQYVTPWLYLMFLFSPVTSSVLVAERQAGDTAWQFAIVASSVISLWLGATIGYPRTAVAIFAIVMFLVKFLYYGWVVSVSGARYVRVMKQISYSLLVPTGVTVCGWLIMRVIDMPLIIIVLTWMTIALLMRPQLRTVMAQPKG